MPQEAVLVSRAVFQHALVVLEVVAGLTHHAEAFLLFFEIVAVSVLFQNAQALVLRKYVVFLALFAGGLVFVNGAVLNQFRGVDFNAFLGVEIEVLDALQASEGLRVRHNEAILYDRLLDDHTRGDSTIVLEQLESEIAGLALLFGLEGQAVFGEN